MDPSQALAINGEEDEDEALRRAIAMSLEGVNSGAAHYGPEDPAKPESASIDLTSSPPTEQSRPEQPAAVAAPSSSFSMLGMDRKRMEEERLARLKKRKAAGSDGTSTPPAKRPAPSFTNRVVQDRVRPATLPGTAARKAHASDAPETTVLAGAREGARIPAGRSSDALPFPKGIVKKTWAHGCPRAGDDIKFEEVLQAKDLELAVLSSFQWDEEWLLSKINIQKTKVVLVAYASDDNQKAEMKANVPSNIRFCFPPMHGNTCMHSKLQLLKYAKYLRIVVPTGNLVSYDWGETGVMENTVFMIDLPRLEDAEKRDSNHLTPFGDELCYFLKAQGLDDKLIHSLHNYNFAGTAPFGFVHTIAGSHYDGAWQRTGYCGLGRKVKALNLETSGPVEIDFICSSVGSLKMDLLTALYNACQGDSGMGEFQPRTNRSKKSKNSSSTGDSSESIKDRFRVYFPSSSTVEKSRGGKGAAGTICLQSKWWNAPTFPKEVLRDLVNVRSSLLLHSKLMFVRPHSEPEASWAYIGSANMSESAWGRLVKEQGTGKTKLTCRNWECGVLIRANAISSSTKGDDTTQSSAPKKEELEGPRMLDIFRAAIPIPVEVPAHSYHDDKSKRPWFFLDW